MTLSYDRVFGGLTNDERRWVYYHTSNRSTNDIGNLSLNCTFFTPKTLSNNKIIFLGYNFINSDIIPTELKEKIEKIFKEKNHSSNCVFNSSNLAPIDETRSLLNALTKISSGGHHADQSMDNEWQSRCRATCKIDFANHVLEHPEIHNDNNKTIKSAAEHAIREKDNHYNHHSIEIESDDFDIPNPREPNKIVKAVDTIFKPWHKQSFGENMGGLAASSTVGGLIGTAVFPGVGTAIGAAVGFGVGLTIKIIRYIADC